MAERHSLWYNLLMAIIPNPVSGQPLDVAYINSIVNEVNRLTTSTSTTNTRAYINDVQLVQNPRIAALHYPLNNLSLDAGKNASVTIAYAASGQPNMFKDIPVVNATYQMGGTSTLDNETILTIVSVTKTNVVIKVTNKSSKKVTLSGRIHVMAIGYPGV